MQKSDIPRPSDIIVAMLVLTRLPMPAVSDAALARVAPATWAFPLAGVMVAGLGALAGYGVVAAGLPAAVAAGVLLAVQIMASGAMHEDGLADVADGFWGGYTVKRRLEIMKDSMIGSYGVIALILSIGLRWVALTALVVHAPEVAVAVAALSRAGLPALMRLLPPARDDGMSHDIGAPPIFTCLLSALVGYGLAAMIAGGFVALIATGGVIAGLVIAALVAKWKIDGQTGDVLGASQQLGDIIALSLLASLAAQM